MALRIPLAADPQQTPPASPEPPVFGEFIERVQQYITLQKALPRLRTTTKRKEIVERREALAERIRKTRSKAKRGDIFTPEISAEFRRLIQSAFQGPGAPNVLKTIRKGEPVRAWRPKINGDYPEDLPLTTVPPTLLLRLPQLPEEVAYRVVGRDLVLQDMEARVVIDFIPGALP